MYNNKSSYDHFKIENFNIAIKSKRFSGHPDTENYQSPS